MDCFVKAFTALAKVLPQERFCLEKDQESVDAANENLAQLKEMIKKMVESGSMDMKVNSIRPANVKLGALEVNLTYKLCSTKMLG